MEDILCWKTSFVGRQSLKEEDLWWKIFFELWWPLTKEDFWCRTTFDGRWHLMEDKLWWKTTFNRRQLLMEDVIWWKTIFGWYMNLDVRSPLMEDNLEQRKMTFCGRKQCFRNGGFLNLSLTLKTKSCYKVVIHQPELKFVHNLLQFWHQAQLLIHRKANNY